MVGRRAVCHPDAKKMMRNRLNELNHKNEGIKI